MRKDVQKRLKFFARLFISFRSFHQVLRICSQLRSTDSYRALTRFSRDKGYLEIRIFIILHLPQTPLYFCTVELLHQYQVDSRYPVEHRRHYARFDVSELCVHGARPFIDSVGIYSEYRTAFISCQFLPVLHKGRTDPHAARIGIHRQSVQHRHIVVRSLIHPVAVRIDIDLYLIDYPCSCDTAVHLGDVHIVTLQRSFCYRSYWIDISEPAGRRQPGLLGIVAFVIYSHYIVKVAPRRLSENRFFAHFMRFFRCKDFAKSVSFL